VYKYSNKNNIINYTMGSYLLYYNTDSLNSKHILNSLRKLPPIQHSKIDYICVDNVIIDNDNIRKIVLNDNNTMIFPTIIQSIPSLLLFEKDVKVISGYHDICSQLSAKFPTFKTIPNIPRISANPINYVHTSKPLPSPSQTQTQTQTQTQIKETMPVQSTEYDSNIQNIIIQEPLHQQVQIQHNQMIPGELPPGLTPVNTKTSNKLDVDATAKLIEQRVRY